MERINYLWQQFSKREATEKEVDELFMLMADSRHDQAALEFLETLRYHTKPLTDYDPKQWEPVIARILQKEGDGVRSSFELKQPVRGSWFKYAAVIAALSVLGAVIYLWLPKKSSPAIVQTTVPVTEEKSIAPGNNKAVLTLADGSTIVLNDAQNGTLAEQSGASIIKSDDQIIYHNPSKMPSGSAPEYNVMTTPRGGQYQLRLSDGTKVWLNATSSITYPTVFAADKRTVSVIGEVYFEVAKDRAKPFHVKVNAMDVEVLGTHFNINSYSDEAAIKTTLLEGSIKIVKGSASQILQPGQQSIAGNELQLVKNIDMDQVIAWKNGAFNFSGLSVKDAMRQISRWYDVEVEYAPGLSQQRFWGEMGRNLTLEQVLKLLDGMGMHFKLEGKKILVYP